jgi:hypothetical protein
LLIYVLQENLRFIIFVIGMFVIML